jgi:hypothetical protein
LGGIASSRSLWKKEEKLKPCGKHKRAFLLKNPVASLLVLCVLSERGIFFRQEEERLGLQQLCISATLFVKEISHFVVSLVFTHYVSWVLRDKGT